MKLERKNIIKIKLAALLAVPGIPPVGFGGTSADNAAFTDDATLLHICIGLKKQLFFDDLPMESVQDITREFHHPRKYDGNPLIVKDKPWEDVVQFRTSGYTILRDPKDKLFKAWYTDQGFANEIVRRGITWSPYRSLYAYSEDGFHWIKPPLGIHSEVGQDTNIYSTGFDERIVLRDLSEPDGPKRFKSIRFRAPEVNPDDGHVLATYSADGLYWKNQDETPSFGKFGPHLGDSKILSYDPDSKLHILTTHHPKMGAIAQNPRFPKTRSSFRPYYPEDFARMEKRRIFQSESKDFIHWSEPKLIIYPDEEDNLDDYFSANAALRGETTRTPACRACSTHGARNDSSSS